MPNYDTMPAGREMDALVAQLVMEDEVCAIHLSLFCCGRPNGGWSTDVGAAWKDLVPRLCEIYHDVSIAWNAYQWFVELGREGVFEVTTAKTAELAICRAALKAVS